MGFAYKFDNADGVYFITTAVVEWVDAFTRHQYCDIVVDSLKYCIENKGLILHAWVIMPNHIHLIISRNGEAGFGDIMRDFKKFTSARIAKEIQTIPESRKDWMMWLFKSAGEQNPKNNQFQFWQQENHPIELTSSKFTQQKLDYIHDNPVRARIVDAPERYVYSSAKDYYGEKGLLPVEILDSVFYGLYNGVKHSCSFTVPSCPSEHSEQRGALYTHEPCCGWLCNVRAALAI